MFNAEEITVTILQSTVITNKSDFYNTITITVEIFLFTTESRDPML